MAYNNPQYSAYVSTAAGTQAALQGISNSTSKIAQIVNARQQRELQERKEQPDRTTSHSKKAVRSRLCPHTSEAH